MRRPAPPRPIPPPLELECLRALWSVGEGSVHDVREALPARRNLAYTTVMTVLDRLVRRGRVERRKIGRAFFYSPVASRDELRRAAVGELVDLFFDGSQEALLDYLRGEPEEPPRAEPVAEDARLDEALL
jgi:predicted transcriptional regulator